MRLGLAMHDRTTAAAFLAQSHPYPVASV